MYGTVAKMHVKPGAEEEIKDHGGGEVSCPGHIATYVFKSDKDPNVHIVTTIFESKSAYRKFSESPEQDRRFNQMKELLAGEPEWNDGEVIHQDTRVEATR